MQAQTIEERGREHMAAVRNRGDSNACCFVIMRDAKFMAFDENRGHDVMRFMRGVSVDWVPGPSDFDQVAFVHNHRSQSPSIEGMMMGERARQDICYPESIALGLSVSFHFSARCGGGDVWRSWWLSSLGVM